MSEIKCDWTSACVHIRFSVWMRREREHKIFVSVTFSLAPLRSSNCWAIVHEKSIISNWINFECKSLTMLQNAVLKTFHIVMVCSAVDTHCNSSAENLKLNGIITWRQQEQWENLKLNGIITWRQRKGTWNFVSVTFSLAPLRSSDCWTIVHENPSFVIETILTVKV